MGTETDTEIRRLEARINNLEAQIGFLMKVNGLEVSALRDAPDEELLKYYQDSVQLLGLRAQQFSPEVVQIWAELFCQISEYELVRLQSIVEYDHTWEPFFTLCIKMMTAVRQQPGFATNGELRNLYGLLERARRNLRDAAVIISKRCPESLSQRAIVLLRGDELPLGA